MSDNDQKVTPIWERQAEESSEEKTRVSLTSAVRALSSPEWDCLAFNERESQTVFLDKPPCFVSHRDYPAPLIDEDFVSIVGWFDAKQKSIGFDSVVKAAKRTATFRAFDPVQQHLDGLEWDEEKRIESWLETYFGATTEDEDERRWNAEIGRRWLISGVARVYEPGCQADHVLIAEGTQGKRKSTALRALAVRDEWFSCDLPPIGSKDAAEHLQGPWIIELDELDALSRKEATQYKGFISRRTDRFRPSYGRLTRNHPRRCVFAGTTNESAYHTDSTGARRFWPFSVRGEIDVEGLERDRDQLWAEAVHAYKAGEPWHIVDQAVEAIGRAEQEARFRVSPWLGAVQKYLLTAYKKHRRSAEVQVDDLLEALGVELGRRTQRDVNEVVRCLQHLGWQRTQVRRDGKRPRVYVPPVDWKPNE